ncbi:MAG: GH3 family domain-containing protein, partial [Mucilaginibacter sp.]
MGLKAALSRVFAAWVNRDINHIRRKSVALQQKTFEYLVAKARDTAFGKDHHFENIRTYDDFKKQVPIRDYEDLRPYIDRITHGDEDILWPGKPEYLAKTSGTTSGVKYIPITKESMPEHIKAARNALLNYIHETGKSDFVNGKMIFLQGSPVMQQKAGISVGRLSGIVANLVPAYLQKNRLP